MRSFRAINHLVKVQGRTPLANNVVRAAWMNQQVAAMSVVPFKLADIGEGIAEVELMKWFVKVSLCQFEVLILFSQF